jgi:hypothetical protein
MTISFFPYIYFSFFNVDPIHDGWFTSPATAIADGATPYKDVITSYGWVSPVFFTLIIKLGGFHLIYFRLFGLLLHVLICLTFFLILRHFLDSGKASLIISMWLLINLGQLTRDPSSLPAWSFWPNQLIVLISLLSIYFLVVREDFRLRIVLILGILAGISPWVRAQGLLTLVAVLFVVTLHLWSTKSRDSLRVWIFFIFAIGITVGTPLAFIIKGGAFNNFRWQTIDMPRTGEWVGMPNPTTWILQNIGLSFIFLIAVVACALLLSRVELSPKVFTLGLSLLLLFLWKMRLNSESHSTNFLHRKLESLAHLYVNYNFFTFPLLVMLGLFILVVMYKGLRFLRLSLDRPRSEFAIYILSLPAVTLIYYNFGHLWGVTPLIFLSLLHLYLEKSFSLPIQSRFVTIIFIYSMVVSLLALPQIYGRMLTPSYSYNVPGLELMRGQDVNQVSNVSRSIELIRNIPSEEKAFFFCEYALYSISKGRYISDNIFYGTSMTKFDLRPVVYKGPDAATRYIIYCHGSNSIDIGHLPGKWALAEFSPDANFLGVQIYKRG